MPAPKARKRISLQSMSQAVPTARRPVLVFVEAHVTATVFDAHLHRDQVQLICALKGTIQITTENSIWIVPPGRAVLIPLGLEHEVRAPNNASIRILGIFPAALKVKSPVCRLLNLSPLIVALIESVREFPRTKMMDGPQSRLVDVLLDQLRAAPDEGFHLPRPRDQRARAVADWLAHDPGDRTTLEGWGRKVGASRRTLARLFEDETGMTFSVYRRQAQLSAAVGMLSAGASVTHVAQELGYESTSAFVQMFRQAMQATPGRYMASLSRATIR